MPQISRYVPVQSSTIDDFHFCGPMRLAITIVIGIFFAVSGFLLLAAFAVKVVSRCILMIFALALAIFFHFNADYLG